MPKRKPLVAQHVEHLSRGVLERYQREIREFVRRRHGIYALYRGEQLYYVGLASNLRTRLKQHLNDRHGMAWNRFSIYLTADVGHMKELESLVLRIVAPQGNRSRGKFAASEDLRRPLNRVLREHQARERAELLGRHPRPAQHRRSSTARSVAGGYRVTLASLVTRSFPIQGKFKRRTHRARVTKAGKIRFGGRTFETPSDAAEWIIKSPRNGWGFWHFERRPGEWAPISELRKP